MYFKKILGALLAIAIMANSALTPAYAALPIGGSSISSEITGETETPQENEDDKVTPETDISQENEDDKVTPETNTPQENEDNKVTPETEEGEIIDATPLNEAIKSEVIEAMELTEPIVNSSSSTEVTLNGNVIQTYTVDGKEHKIYWAQGITPPQMLSDGEVYGEVAQLENTKGFFEKTVVDGKGEVYTTYEASFEQGMGYYDLNKNFDRKGTDGKGINENPLCYLGTASNLIFWWLEQNSSLILQYQELLNAGRDVNFGQYPNLVDIFDPQKWELIDYNSVKLIDPDGKGEYRQELGVTPLVINVLNKYYTKYKGEGISHEPGKESGYFPNLVIDYFINGYKAIKNIVNDSVNHFDEFYPDVNSTGGYFYPIFGKKSLVNVYGSRYDTASNELKKALLSGHGIGISYISPNGAHAITLWGAEYDEKGNLARVYVTDSDDVQTTPRKTNTSGQATYRGIHAYNTNNVGGSLKLTTSNAPNAGSALQQFMTFDLAQEEFSNKLNSLAPPDEPKIDTQPIGNTYAVGATPTELVIEASATESDYLDYQWYKSTETEKDVLINDATKNIYFPETVVAGKTEYYCIITNNKNGKTAKTKSQVAVIEGLENVEIVNAEVPRIAFNTDNVYYSVGSLIEPLDAKASVTDGGELHYQWYRANDNSAVGEKIAGATSSTYTPVLTQTGRYFYFCEVTNVNNSPSITGQRKATAKPRTSKKIEIVDKSLENKINIISTSLNDATYKPNEIAQPLSVEAKRPNDEIVSYQWYVSDTIDGEFKILDYGESFTPPTNEIGEKYYYCLIVAKLYNNSLKEKVKTTIPTEKVKITVKNPTDIVISTQPKSAKYIVNDTSTELNIVANGQEPLKYEWYVTEDKTKDGQKLSEGITVKPSTTKAGTYYYYCIVSDSTGSIKSDFAEIVVNEPVLIKAPTITENPKSAEYIKDTVSSPLRIVAKSNDEGVLSYQWYKSETNEYNGVAIENAIENTYIPATSTVGTSYYYCVVTNTNDKATDKKTTSVNSEIATVKINKLTPTISVNIDSITDDNLARRAVLTVKVEGTKTPTGSVTINDGQKDIVSAELKGGLASLTLTGLEEKEYKLEIRYSGNDSYNNGSIEFIFNPSKQNQDEFRLNPIGKKTYGDDEFILSVVGEKGNGKLVFTSSDPTVISISNDKATILKAGNATITATKYGDDSYNEAIHTENVTVDKKAVTVKAKDLTFYERKILNPNKDTDVIYEGFVNNADILEFKELIELKYEKYDILVSAKLSDKYEPKFIKGKLTVIEPKENIVPTEKLDTEKKEPAIAIDSEVKLENNISKDEVKLVIYENISTEDNEKLDTEVKNLSQEDKNVLKANHKTYEIHLAQEYTPVKIESGMVKVFLPYPSGVDSSYKIILKHYKNNKLVNVDNLQKLANGVSFETDSFSPFIMGWEKPVAPKPTPTPIPDDTPSYEPDERFVRADKVIEKIKEAEKGEIVKVKVADDDIITHDIMRALADGEVRLIIEHNGKEYEVTNENMSRVPGMYVFMTVSVFTQYAKEYKTVAETDKTPVVSPEKYPTIENVDTKPTEEKREEPENKEETKATEKDEVKEEIREETKEEIKENTSKEENPSTSETVTKPTEPKKSNVGLIVAIVIAIIAVAGIGVILYLGRRKD